MDTAISTAAELRRDAREPGLLGLAERGSGASRRAGEQAAAAAMLTTLKAKHR